MAQGQRSVIARSVRKNGTFVAVQFLADIRQLSLARADEALMKIRAGYEISYECPQPTPMILTLSVHPTRVPDLLTWDSMRLDPPIEGTGIRATARITGVNRETVGTLALRVAIVD